MRRASFPLIGGVVLALAGLAMVVASRPRERGSDLTEADPIHPITTTMRQDAEKAAAQTAPTFDRKDTEGRAVDLKKLTSQGPAFLIFIMDTCPCSIEAEPYFQRLYKGFGAKIPFVGVTDGDSDAGKEWKAHFQMTYPMVSDPSKDLMKLFGAKHSAYSALIGKGGQILQLWPGYDQDMLADMQNQLAQASGLPNPHLDVSDAPRKPTSGCVF